MATKQQRDGTPPVTKSRRTAAASAQAAPENSSSSRSFGLVEFAVTSVAAKRILSQKSARRGYFQTEVGVKLSTAKPTHGGLVPALKAKLSLKLDGFSKASDEEGNEANGKKSFSINMEIEAEFKVKGTMRAGEEPTGQEVAYLMANLYPLAATKAQQYAADMGYRTISPDLSMSDEFEISEDND